MAERKPGTKGMKASAPTAAAQASEGFTDDERAAMKERAQELKTAARRTPRTRKADGERDVLAKIAEMPEPDRAVAERIHAIVEASAPALSPRTSLVCVSFSLATAPISPALISGTFDWFLPCRRIR